VVRPYRSPTREAQALQTREAIVAAARNQLLANGYAATTIAAVASAAGVSIATVEATFGTKANLLKAAIDVAIAGDHEPVAMLARPWAERAEATTDAVGFLAVVATVLRESQLRSAGLVVAAFEAAPIDAELRALSEQLVAQRLVTAGWLVDQLSRRAPRRAGLTRRDAVDTVWLLVDPAVFLRLTRDRGWTPARYGRWVSASIARLVLANEDDQHRTRRSTSCS
jgi:AcrR family transcriptional regulator